MTATIHKLKVVRRKPRPGDREAINRLQRKIEKEIDKAAGRGISIAGAIGVLEVVKRNLFDRDE